MPDIRIIVIDSNSALMPGVFALRHDVFVIEQAVSPELERDEFDADAMHLVALRGDEVVGTLRIVKSGQHAKIGRMAVRAPARKSGVGSRLMQTAETIARQLGGLDIVLHAQLTASGFYHKLGYRDEGDPFDEAGIAHIAMRKAIA